MQEQNTQNGRDFHSNSSAVGFLEIACSRKDGGWDSQASPASTSPMWGVSRRGSLLIAVNCSGAETGVHMLGKCCTNEPHFQPQCSFE